jgi:four helix bundle protein
MQYQTLDVYRVALQLAETIHRAAIGDAELRDQLRRASKSAFLNLAEGLPSRSRANASRHFAIAIGSLCETHAGLDLARAISVLDGAECDRLQVLAARATRTLRAMRA